MNDESVSRRRMFTLGAVGGAALFGAAAAPAEAASFGTASHPPGTVPGNMAEGTGELRIGSDAVSGYSYVHRSWHDFYSFGLGARTWSPDGVYAQGVDQWLTSTVDLPSGAVLRDVEWYLSGPFPVSVYAQLWNSGSAFLQTLSGAKTPAGSEGPRAFRQVIPAPDGAPVPLGSKLVLSIPTSPRMRLIGARVGFTQ